MNSNKKILISTHFNPEFDLRKKKYFQELEIHLKALSIDLYYIDLFPLNESTSINHFVLNRSSYYCLAPDEIEYQSSISSKAFHDFANINYHFFQEPGGELKKSPFFKKYFKKPSLEIAKLELINYESFMVKLLDKIQPDAVILWNQFTGHHQLLFELMKRRNITAIYAEYGLMPETIIFDVEGQLGGSPFSKIGNYKASPPKSSLLHKDKLQSILDDLRDKKKTRKNQNITYSIKDNIEKAKANGKKIIFYAGQNDYNSGLFPKDSEHMLVNSPLGLDTIDGFDYLVDLAKKNNWFIIFKPHPLLEKNKTSIRIESQFFKIVHDANIFECINESDITVTILSQVCYLALIHEKPVVLLGKNQVSNKNCAYEPKSLENIEAEIKDALNHKNFIEKKDNWLKHTFQLYQDYLFNLNSEDDFLKSHKGPAKAAEYIKTLI
jgi:hypothetical protein